jgi:hypothetical protein
MHADKKIRTLMAERRSVYNQVGELTQPAADLIPASRPYCGAGDTVGPV